MDPFTIAQLVAAAVSYFSQSKAASAQKRAAVESQQRALNAQNEATDVAMKQVQQFDPTVRQQKQDAIATDLTSQYDQAAQTAPITAQGVQVGATIPDAAGTTDYLKAKAGAAAKAAASNHALASLFGRIGSAGQLRADEGVAFGDTAGQIGRIGEGADNVGQIDQLGIQAAGQPSLGAQLVSGALGAYGKAGGMLNGVLKKPGAVNLSPGALSRSDGWA